MLYSTGIINSSIHTRHRLDIDGLRGVSVLAVVIYHAFPDWMAGGYTGVDVFFVISGYVISRIIFDSLNDDQFNYYHFCLRRAKRILPSLCVVVISCLAFGWFALLPKEFQQLGKHAVGAAGFFQNFILLSELNYFDKSSAAKPLLHLWSLAIEVQFYLIFPFAILWLERRRVLQSATLAYLIILFASIYLLQFKINSTTAFYMPHTRFWEFMCGSLLAHSIDSNQSLLTANVKTKYKYLVWKSESAMSVLGMSMLLYCFFLGNGNWSFSIISVVGAMVVINASANGFVNKNILASTVLVNFGKISFPLYLWHWPLLSFFYIIENGEINFQFRMIAILLALLLSSLTYYKIELPVRYGKKLQSSVSLLVSIILIIGMAGLFVWHNKGYPHRLQNVERDVIEIISEPYPRIEQVTCSHIFPELAEVDFDDCVLSKSALPTIMFIGDSHTKQFRSTDWKNFAPDGILMLTKSECLPFANDKFINKEPCKEVFNRTIEFISEKNSINTVVLAGYWAYLISGVFDIKGENWRIPRHPFPEDVLTFQSSANLFIERAIFSGKRVILILDAPDLNFNIETCFDTRPLRVSAYQIRESCTIEKSEYIQRIQAVENILIGIGKKFPDLEFFDPRQIFCNEVKCAASDGMLPYYTDGDHLNHYGSRLIIDKLREHINSNVH